MTITREQVADLQPGDVVEIVQGTFPDITIRGPLRVYVRGELWLGDLRVTAGDSYDDQRIAWATDEASTLTVVSRAPRPLYVNHPRTEPVPGDVVRQEDGCPSGHTWHYLGYETPRWWRFDDTRIPFDKGARLRLLVDGETGQVVP